MGESASCLHMNALFKMRARQILILILLLLVLAVPLP